MPKLSAEILLFFLAAGFAISPWCSPPIALLLGAAIALTLGNPYAEPSKAWSRVLLQVSVVLLGFAMDLHVVIEAGRNGLVFALISIGCVFALGFLLQRLLNVRPLTSILVSTGTAICGGSAIAAMSTVLDAPQEDVSVSVGTVFLLNAVGLCVFPLIGHAMGLTAAQFGVWSGIAIHDVSSVVGAATVFASGSVAIATAVKLSRVLYLVPIILIATFHHKRNQDFTGSEARPSQIPWFIGLFLLASLSRTYWPQIEAHEIHIKTIATTGFSLSLFLIGAGLTRQTLRQVGFRPLLQGILLWAFISVASLMAVRLG